jgi:hypothetical protein
MFTHPLVRSFALLVLASSAALALTASAIAHRSAVAQTPASLSSTPCPGPTYENNWKPGLAHIWLRNTKRGPWACFVRKGTKVAIRFGAFYNAQSFYVRIELRALGARCVPVGNGAMSCSPPKTYKSDIVFAGRPSASGQITWTAKRGNYAVCVTAAADSRPQVKFGTIELCQHLNVR